MSASLTNSNNKALLWSLLQGQGSFNNIPEQYISNVKADFEKVIYEHSQTNMTLIEANKSVISSIHNKLKKYKQQQPEPPQQPPQQAQLLSSNDSMSGSYTQKQLQNDRAAQLNQKQKAMEQNFSNTIHAKKPGEINFNDEMDDAPIGDDMEDLLQRTISQREQQLDIVSNDTSYNKEDASKWLNQGQEVQLSIGEDTQLKENQVIHVDKRGKQQAKQVKQAKQEKKVHFSDSLTNPQIEIMQKDILDIKNEFTEMKKDISIIKTMLENMQEQSIHSPVEDMFTQQFKVNNIQSMQNAPNVQNIHEQETSL